MKKLIIIIISVLISLSAQDITNKLGGNTAAETYDVTDSAVNVLLRLQGDNSFVLKGTRGTGTIPATGAGTRMMWYPAKAAFRVGYVGGTNWDDGNIGNYSMAFGRGTIASGEYSTAFGRQATASGDYSTAIGREIEASGNYSVVIALNDQNGNNVTQDNTMAIMGGKVGIGTKAPDANIDIHGTVKMFGEWDNTSYSTETVYQAATDGIVHATITASDDKLIISIGGMTGSSNPPPSPSKLYTLDWCDGVGTHNNTVSITLVVKKGDYWMITDGLSGTITDDSAINWIPLGQ